MTKRDATLEALAEARHDDPFGVLGPHVEREGRRRPRLPADSGPRRSGAQRLGPGADEAATSGRHFRSGIPGLNRHSRLPPRREVRRWQLSLSWTIPIDTGGC